MKLKEKLTRRRVCYLSLISIPLLILLNLFLKLFPNFTEQVYSRNIYKFIATIIAWFTSIISFSLIEILIVLIPFVVAFLAGFLIKSLIQSIINKNKPKKKKPDVKRYSLNILALLCVLLSFNFALYTLGLSFNYNRMPISTSLNINAAPPSKEELVTAYEYIIKKANEACVELDWNSFNEPYYNGDFTMETIRAFKVLENRNSVFKGAKIKPKPLLASNIMHYSSIVAFFSPYTYETNYVTGYPAFSIPQTLCHEAAHLRGFAKEDEAEYIGFLACISSTDSFYRLSGYMYAYNLFGSAVRAVDRKLYDDLVNTADRRIRSEWNRYFEFTEEHKGKAKEVTNSLNDAYIKSQGVAGGVQSYDQSLLLIIGQLRADGVIS